MITASKVRIALTACIGVAAVSALMSCISDRTTAPPVDLTGCNVELPAEAFGTTIVVMKNFAFTPAQVNVRQGTKVTWVHCATETDPHTSTSDAAGAAGWDSPFIPPGGTFTQEFTTAGTFPYHCVPHPSMTGSVAVN